MERSYYLKIHNLSCDEMESRYYQLCNEALELCAKSDKLVASIKNSRKLDSSR
ncbi:MAG: hypothetical protein AAB656_04335 [Patescibacteria group bacterium]